MLIPEKVDTIIDAGWVIPVCPDARTSLLKTSIIIKQEKIHDILPTVEAHKKYESTTHLDRTSSVVLPGLVNAHTHAGMTLLRGKADDMSLLPWLHEKIWPMEGVFAGKPEFCRDGTILACAEMIRGGVTTFADMYFNSETTAPAVLKIGIRSVLGLILFKFPSKYASGPDEYLTRANQVYEQWKDQYPKLSFAYTPHAPYTVETKDWLRLKEEASKRNIPIHTHLHETKDECIQSKLLNKSHPACHLSESRTHPLIDLDNHGLLSDKFVAVHMVHLTDDEIQICKQRQVHVVHCPTSNSKLASGFSPVPKLLENGINVALGTDSACSNNSLDIRAEMKLAALNAKNLTFDASTAPAYEVIKMATINGARAFGLDPYIGSLEIGKKADLICIQVESHPGNSPVYNPHAAVVYASERADVRDVLVDGQFLLKDWKYCTLDIDEVMANVKHWQSQILEKFPE